MFLLSAVTAVVKLTTLVELELNEPFVVNTEYWPFHFSIFERQPQFSLSFSTIPVRY